MQRILKLYLSIFIACLPLYIIRFRFGHYPSTLLELLFFGFVLLIGFYHANTLRRLWFVLTLKPTRPMLVSSILTSLMQQKLLFVCLAIFLLSGVISVVIAHDHRAALGILKAYLLEPVIFFGLLQTIREKKIILDGFLFGSMLLLSWLFLLCLLQIGFHKAIFAPDELKLNRATGVYTTANALGLLLGPFGTIYTALAVVERRQRRLLYLGCIVICAAIIILSQSLTALIAFIAAELSVIVLYLLPMTQRIGKWLSLGIDLGIPLFILGSLFFLYLILPQLAPTTFGPNFGNDSLAIRLYIWHKTANLLLHHPLGFGFSSFPAAFAQYLTSSDENFRRGFVITPLYPHTIILNFWTEMGLLGMVSFFGLCSCYLKRLVTNRANMWALGLTGAMIYIVLHGLTDVPYFKNDLAMAFWLFFGLAYLLPQKIRD